MPRVLGIESSCDETAVAIVDDTRHVFANLVRTQYEHHAPYGGVVPEIAARAHIEWLEPMIEEALSQSQLTMQEIDAIAVTAGPGLIGGVIVGVMTAKTLASIYRKPFIAVNHLEGHALTVRLCEEVAFPYLLLLVSGGHYLYAIVRGVGDYHLLGTTRDDALGEAFDKCAKMMSLPYPGGPSIERIAKMGNPHAHPFATPMVGTAGCDVSFSGLKTSVRYRLRERMESGLPLTDEEKADVAASFQHCVCAILKERTAKALDMAMDTTGHAMPLVVAGGVAANQAIYQTMQQLTNDRGIRLYVPPAALCTDNAAMIAWTGLERFQRGLVDPLSTEPRARWSLSELSTLSG